MTKYIDADALEYTPDSFKTNYEVKLYIDKQPAADVAEVVHGRWIREDETQALLSVMWHCSKCEIPLEMNGIYTPIGAGYKYCPNCGAKMDGEKEGV